MTIHKEGKSLLFYLMVVLIAINVGIIYLWPQMLNLQNIAIILSIFFYLIILQFFRNPSITIHENSNQVLAPADGKVVVIEKTHEGEHFNDDRIQISIFMSPVNVHINRTPVAGQVKYFKYHPGKYLVAWHPKSSTDNERTSMVIAMADGVEILIRQIAGAMARRIKWYVKEGSKLSQGQEFGFIKFGSRVDVFLPPSSIVLVATGTKTRAGKTVLAELV